MKKSVGNIFIGLMYTLLYAPLLVMVFFSFNEVRVRPSLRDFP